MQNQRRQLPWLGVVTIVLALASAAADWPHWRGADRNDVVRESSGWRGGQWLADRPDWRVAVGAGATSPVAVGDRVFVMDWRDGSDKVACLDAATGREIWSASYRCPERGRHATGDEGLYLGPSSTPSYDGASQRLFTMSIDGDLRAWDAATGRAIWNMNLYDTYGVGQRPRVGRQGRRDYGYPSSPLVLGDSVIVEVGDDEGTLMAFSKETGHRKWSSECRDPAGHTGTPVPITVDGLSCVAVLTLRQLVVVRLDAGHEGRTLATYPWETDFANNIPTPAVHDNFVLLTSKYNHDTICKLRITRDGATKVWEQPFASGVCSPVIHAGRVYWSTDQVICLDFETGNLVWQGGRFGDAGSCILTSDEKLIVWANRGSLALIDAARSATSYRELFRRELNAGSDVWPHVVLSGGRLFCKDREGSMTCFTTGRSE
jgi:outer membrane protein assembly factor BamB